MSRSEICPTCGTKLGPTHPRAAMRVCTSCQRSNPEGFSYCGFCASPMENTEMRARMTELAAPPGGWPNITSELVEVRFYLQQGLLDDAYELLSIMQKRYPGHPQLSELVRRPKPSKRVDTGVLALVDSVLAESANLVAKVPRRAAPQFQAPSPGSPNRTDVHAPVEPAPRSSARARTGKTGAQPTSAPSPKPVASASPSPIESSRAARTASNGAAPRTTTRAPSGSQSAPTGPQAQARSEGEPIPVARERTRIYRTVEAPGAVRQAPPIAVPPSSASTRAASGSHPTTPETAGPSVSGSIASRSSGAHTPVAAEAVPRVRIDPPKGGTQVRPVPQTGNTMVVDALQPAAPFAGGDTMAEAGADADDATEAEASGDAESSAASSSRRARGEKRRRRNAEAAAAKPAPAPSESTSGASPDGDESPRRRRTTFGEHVLNRLR